MSSNEKSKMKGPFVKNAGRTPLNFVWTIILKIKLKKSKAWTSEKRKVSSSSSPFPLMKLFVSFPKMIWKEGRIMAKSLVVKKKRKSSPNGPESFLDREMKFSSLRTFFAIMVL
jgi:hypothetical protein